MRDLLAALFLLGSGAYIYWTSLQPGHANPRFARGVAGGLAALGVGALLFLLWTRF